FRDVVSLSVIGSIFGLGFIYFCFTCFIKFGTWYILVNYIMNEILKTLYNIKELNMIQLFYVS
ncbi:hypothetical protein ACJX0J_026192, partial [Zea mays]